MLRACLGRKEGRKAAAAEPWRRAGSVFTTFLLLWPHAGHTKDLCFLGNGLFPHVLQRVGQVCLHQTPTVKENELQRSCPGAASLIAAAALICIPLRKRQKNKKISLLPLAEEIPPGSLQALSLSEGRGNCFHH